MRIPIKVRTVSLTPRIPDGNDSIQIIGEALTGGTIFKFSVARVQLAEALSLTGLNGVTTPATLLELEGMEQPPVAQAAEDPEQGRALRF